MAWSFIDRKQEKVTMKSLACFSIAVWAWAASGCGAGVDEKPPPGDPIGFTFESTAGSVASFGWTGAVHDVVEPPGTPFGVKTTECRAGVCRFEGPTDPGGKVNRQRCLFRMSKTCNADTDCPLDGAKPTPCVYIYDTPIATPLRGSTNKLGACAWSYIPIAAAGQPPTIAGTLNLASGTLNLENLTVLLPLNSNPDGTFRGACAECIGDTKPNDGVREGTCKLATHRGDLAAAADPDMSPDLGMPCDINRTGTIGGYDGNYSMDCSPTVIASPRPPLQFGGSFTSSGFQISLSDRSPDCTAPGQKCFCGMCPDNKTACMSKEDCGGLSCTSPPEAICQPNPLPGDPSYDPKLGVNQCKADPTKFAVFSNDCFDGICKWDEDKGVGSCKSRWPDQHVVGCYPSGPNASIVAPGYAQRDDHVGTIYQANTAGASCIPAGPSVQLNSQLGLPGLLFQKRNFQIIPAYEEDKK
jgi:hypothetical protein